MLLGQLHSDLLENGSDISLKCGEHTTITVDNDEAELLVVFKQILEDVRMELILTSVYEVLTWPKWFNVQNQLLFGLVVILQNLSAEDNETVCWSLSVELQLFSG